MTGTAKDERLPVTIVTGFLGSGKTTFLRRSLNEERFKDALLLVNEAAPYGVDDKLLRSDAVGVALLANGCICCRIDKDVKEELHRIFAFDDEVLRFGSVIVELSGLADPVAVIATIAGDPYLNARLRIEFVVTLVDCLHAVNNDREHLEHKRQIEAADIILLTKADLVTPELAQNVRELTAALAPLAPCLVAEGLHLGDLAGHAARLRPDRLGAEEFATLAQARLARSGAFPTASVASQFFCRPPEAVSFCIRIDGRLDWTRLSLWLSLLVHMHGEKILRIKGFLALDETEAPVLVNCVRHVVYFPEHVDEWPDDSRASCLVFIVQEIDPELVMQSLGACVAGGSGDCDKFLMLLQ